MSVEGENGDADRWRPDGFEDRYGAGAETRLLALFQQPCVTFAEIGARFGVTRERVRQWHRELMPDAPRGHARQRLCRLLQQKRRLFADSLFRAFYRDARSQIAPNRLMLLQTRDGFRKRAVKLDGWTISLRAGRAVPKGSAGPQWKLAADRADFIYYRLGDEGFFCVPRQLVSRSVVVDANDPRFARYRDTFAAVFREPHAASPESPLVQRIHHA